MQAMKFWKEFDDTVFKLPKEKWELGLAERKEEIIGHSLLDLLERVLCALLLLLVTLTFVLA